MANFRLFNMDAVYARKNLKKIAWVPIRGIIPMPRGQVEAAKSNWKVFVSLDPKTKALVEKMKQAWASVNEANRPRKAVK